MVALFPRELGVSSHCTQLELHWLSSQQDWEWSWEEGEEKAFWWPINIVPPFS